MLKQEIETKVLPVMEARLNRKIDAIIKVVEKENDKNHRKQRSSSNMLVASSSSSEPPSNHKAKNNQYHSYIVYPPKAKIELSMCNGSEEQSVSWVNKANEYFDIYNITSDEEKVNMRQCFWKGTPIIGTCGGRETIFPTPGTCSKTIFLIGFKELQKMIF